MKKEALSQFGHPDLVLFGFLLFVAVFVYVLIRVTFLLPKHEVKFLSHLPLNDENSPADNPSPISPTKPGDQ